MWLQSEKWTIPSSFFFFHFASIHVEMLVLLLLRVVFKSYTLFFSLVLHFLHKIGIWYSCCRSHSVHMHFWHEHCVYAIFLLFIHFSLSLSLIQLHLIWFISDFNLFRFHETRLFAIPQMQLINQARKIAFVCVHFASIDWNERQGSNEPLAIRQEFYRFVWTCFCIMITIIIIITELYYGNVRCSAEKRVSWCLIASIHLYQVITASVRFVVISKFMSAVLCHSIALYIVALYL